MRLVENEPCAPDQHQGTDSRIPSFCCLYSFGTGNNAPLIESVLASRPWWKPTADDAIFAFRWQQLTPTATKFNKHCGAGQKVVFNHLPGQRILHSKSSLFLILRQALGMDCFLFLPVTYMMSSPLDRQKFIAHYNFLEAEREGLSNRSAGTSSTVIPSSPPACPVERPNDAPGGRRCISCDKDPVLARSEQPREDLEAMHGAQAITTVEVSPPCSCTRESLAPSFILKPQKRAISLPRCVSTNLVDPPGSQRHPLGSSSPRSLCVSECRTTKVEANMKNLWICKPIGLNRGRGIRVVGSPQEAMEHIRMCHLARLQRSESDPAPEKKQGKANISEVPKITADSAARMPFLVQKYIESPLLIDGRKFDIRCYGLVLSNGEGYVYDRGYLRLASAQYSLDTDEACVHLTNNAVQKNLNSYSTFEDGNMLHFDDLCNYMRSSDPSLPEAYFTNFIWPQIKRYMTIAMVAAGPDLLGSAACDGCYELFGFDFMITSKEDDYRPVLIEANSNPCMALSSSVSWDILPRMLDDLFALTLDRIFPVPRVFRDKMDHIIQLTQSGKTSVIQEAGQLRIGRAEAGARPPGLRWGCISDPLYPVVQRDNLFIRVMSSWRAEGMPRAGAAAKDLRSLLALPSLGRNAPLRNNSFLRKGRRIGFSSISDAPSKLAQRDQADM